MLKRSQIWQKLQINSEYSKYYLEICSLNRTFAPRKHCHGLSLVPSRHERKVRAAQGAPLLKVEAIGDSRCRQKKTTASPRRGKGEKVV